ncbi:NLP/P60 family secreted protein [Streptomyces hygroscopicus subsp. limoneus]|nr:NLP/P60 family secreted protein [Streptomyces hygroscopicus subsp. limoneus]
MASHRKPRPGGTQPRPGGAEGAGVRTPALATAALTSVAVLSQTAGAASSPVPGRPSQEEIERKIEDFYRRAESATETTTAGRNGGRGDRGVGRAGRGTGLVDRGAGGADRGAALVDRGVEGADQGIGGADRRAGRADRESWRAERGAERGDWGAALVDRGAEGGERVESAATSRRPADSLQRLRDEVARRAQHRGLAGQRPMIPAQRGTISARGAAMTSPAGDTAMARPVGGTAIPAPVPDTGVAVPTPSTVASPSALDMTAAPSALDMTATAPVPDTPSTPPTDRQAEVAGNGPKAAKATVQKKLAHARVLLSQRTAQPTAAPSTATASTAAPTIAKASTAAPFIATASTAAPFIATASTATASTAAPFPAAPATTAATTAVPSSTVPFATPTPATPAPATPAPATPAPAAAAPPAAAPSGTYATKARKAIAFARAQVGKPCVWGAAGPGSYDCAGLTQAAWKSAGVTLPRTAREQADAGTPVAPADARPGDLVFFHDDAGHVGLCTGDGMMIHAPRPGAYVREEPVSGIGAAVHSVVRPG